MSSIPSLNRYLGGNIKALRISILIGSFIHMFISWQLGTHGVLTQSVFTNFTR